MFNPRMHSTWYLFRARNLTSLLTASALTLATGCLPGANNDQDPDENNSTVNHPSNHAHNNPENHTPGNQNPGNQNPGNQDPGANAQPTPPTGQTEFVSADGRNGQRTQENDDASGNNAEAAEPGADFDGAADEERTVEEGDIYRVATGQSDLIFNLNSYRGFQVIDFTDVTSPEIIGHVQLSGTPVEMYQVGDRVFVLLNNWYSYWNSRYASTPQRHHGGGVVVIDISDKTNPKIKTQARIDGWISTSRLTRGNDKEALFVVSSEWNGGGQTNVTSFSVNDLGKLVKKTELSLGGYVQDIQATPDRLIVSRYDWNNNRDKSEISLIDISNPEGTMVEGDSVLVEGRVNNKHNMNIHGDVLRIVSGSRWGGTNTNHVQTYDAKDFKTLTRIDHKTFGDNEDLYATLFMENSAFFVTYRRVDPFHAFEITDTGMITEKSEFIVSGWNDYFRPVAQKSRLIGIGKNDENGSTMAVSLYDITDLSNPSPMITRAEVELDWSWSEAQWDDRAFSVLEKATSIPSPDGSVTETGLVLLPFSGWNETEKRYISAVQIFTFSNNTLTLRGVMDHGSPVRRSFLADRTNNTTANLSEAELSLFDTKQPDAPEEKGRVELAPNYSNFTIFGDYGVRHHDRSDYYGWWGSRGQNQQTDSLQIVSLDGDVDRAKPVATIEVPAHAQTHRVGDLLVSISTRYEPGPNDDWNNGQHVSDVEVWDLSDPASPTLESTLTTTELGTRGYYGGWGWDDCWDCGYYGYYGYDSNATAVGDALVIPEYTQQERLEGTMDRRRVYPDSELQRYNQNCYSYDEEGSYQQTACTYFTGSITCEQLTRVDGEVESEVCYGDILFCEQDNMGETSCEEVDPSTIETRTSEWDYEKRRYWNNYTFKVLDLSDPKNPTLGASIEMPEDEESATFLADGDTLYVNYKQPEDIDGDSRPYVRYFVKTVDLSSPEAPVISSPTNVPGELMAIDGDTLLTKDFLWGETIIEVSLNKVELFEGDAYLQNTPYRFVDQQVENVVLDGAGNALASHYTAHYVNYDENHYDWDDYDRTRKLTMIDMAGDKFELASTTEVDEWATLQDARAGRALYQVPGGLLVINLDDSTQPYAQAFYPTRGWPRDINMDGEDIYFSAGRFGLYKFDLDADNLTNTPD